MSTGHCLHIAWYKTGRPLATERCCRCYDNTLTLKGITVQAWDVCQIRPTITAQQLLWYAGLAELDLRDQLLEEEVTR